MDCHWCWSRADEPVTKNCRELRARRSSRRLLFRFKFLNSGLQRIDFLLLQVNLLLLIGQLRLPGPVVHVIGIGVEGVLIQSKLALQEIEFL